MLITWIYRQLTKKREKKPSSDGPQTDTPETSKDNDAPPPPPAAPAPASGFKFGWASVLLMIALFFPIFLDTLDYTVVATAQPHIASVFHRLDLQSYIGTAYLLTSACFLPLFASVADIFGRHWALQISLCFFVIGSALSTGAQSMIMMIMGRGVAGIGAAGLLAVVRIILSDVRSLDANTWQVAILFFLYAVGYSVGPVIGGALVSVSFRWVFAINLPCCVLAMVLCFLILPGRTKQGQPPRRLPSASSDDQKPTIAQNLVRLDWVGAFFFISGGVLLLLALNWGSTQGWNSTKVIVSLVIGPLLFIACVVWEYVLEHHEQSLNPSSLLLLWADPMIPLAVFRSYDICAVQYASFISGMIMLVMFYFIAIFLTIVNNLSPTKSGAQLVYFAPGLGAGSLIAIRLIKLFRQPKYPIMLGSAVMTVSLGLVAMGTNESKEGLVNGFMALAGVGTGLSIGPLAVQARFVLPAERNAVVTGLTLFFRAFGGTVGLAQCAAVLDSKVKSYFTSLFESGTLSPADLASLALASSNGGLNSIQSIDNLSPELQTLVRDAFRRGTFWCFISLIPWSGLSFVTTLFLSDIEDTDKVEEKKTDRGGSEEKKPVEKEEAAAGPV